MLAHAAALGALGSLSASALVEASPPPLVWQDVAAIGVQCVVKASPSAFRHDLATELCERVRRIASTGAPTAIRIIAPGDPAILEAGRVTLLIHASAEASASGSHLLAFTIRPFRVSSEQTSVLYGAAPRAVMLAGTSVEGSSLDSALEEALSETLPWLGRRDRRISIDRQH